MTMNDFTEKLAGEIAHKLNEQKRLWNEKVYYFAVTEFYDLPCVLTVIGLLL